MATQAEIVNDITAALAVTEPDLATGIGSITRKIIDPVAEAIAERDADSYLHTYAYDLDAKSGADLDEMVRLFGFSRLPTQRASGEVTFSRTTPSATPIIIPLATQVATSSGVLVQTVVPAVLPAGDLSISVPAQALEGGSSGNVSAATLTEPRSPISGITAVTNAVSFTGGTDAEDDKHLRARFRATVFRSLAGTEQMFLGVALNDPNVSQANVVGATKRWRERVEIVSGNAVSTVQDASYIVPESSVVGADIQGGSILKVDAHYTFNDGVNPPEIDVIDSTAMPDGVYDFEFEYVPNASRNDLANGISNRVDVYVKGERATVATETLIFVSTRQFNNTSSSPLYRQNFRRTNETVPTNGNFFVPYALVPVIDPGGTGGGDTLDSITDSITIAGVTYNEGVHYWLVYDITNKGNAPRSLAGIEMRSAANGSPKTDPANGARFVVNYVYNAVPRSIEAAIGGTWRLVNQDVWVHQASLLRLRLNFAVVIERGYTQQAVQDALVDALGDHIDSIGFNNVLQASDLLAVAHSVAGVDAIRFLTDEDDGTHYAIQRVTEAGTVAQTYATGTPARATDVYGGDNETPVLHTVFLDVRAQNTWGSV